MEFYIELTIRTTVTFFLLLTILRFLGKKQIAQFTYFNYVSGIAFGSLAANAIFNLKLPLSKGLFVVFLWGLISWTISLLSLKSTFLRMLFEGVPRYMIKDGKFIKRNLRKEYLTIEDVISLLRQKNKFTLDEVDSAIIELNGKLSTQSKSVEQTIKRKDLNLPIKAAGITLPLIVDGVLLRDNLRVNNLSDEWLANYLKSSGLEAKNVLYMEVGVDGKIRIEKKGHEK